MAEGFRKKKLEEPSFAQEQYSEDRILKLQMYVGVILFGRRLFGVWATCHTEYVPRYDYLSLAKDDILRELKVSRPLKIGTAEQVDRDPSYRWVVRIDRDQWS